MGPEFYDNLADLPEWRKRKGNKAWTGYELIRSPRLPLFALPVTVNEPVYFFYNRVSNSSFDKWFFGSLLTRFLRRLKDAIDYPERNHQKGSSTPWALAKTRTFYEKRKVTLELRQDPEWLANNWFPANVNKEQVIEIIKNWDTDPSTRAKLVRAAQVKLVVENLDAQDPKRQKLALEAMKLIAADPETGMESSAQVNVTISPALQSVLGDLPPAPKLITDSKVYDVEYVEEEDRK